MKVETPLGAYPFEFRRVERRGGCIAITGTVAGLRSAVVLEPSDLRRAVNLVGLLLVAFGVLAAVRRFLRLTRQPSRRISARAASWPK